MEWPRYYFSVEPYKTPDEMARVDSAYSPSSPVDGLAIPDGLRPSSRPSSPGWRLGGCLPAHLSHFAQSTVKQDPPLFRLSGDNQHCLFNEQRPSPLPLGYAPAAEVFCSCTTCYRVLMGQATPEETATWRTARERWRKQKDDGWKELRQKREETVLTVVELEMLRARRVVATALDLTDDEIQGWERQGEKKWKAKARAEAYVRDESLRDGGGMSEVVPEQ